MICCVHFVGFCLHCFGGRAFFLIKCEEKKILCLAKGDSEDDPGSFDKNTCLPEEIRLTCLMSIISQSNCWLYFYHIMDILENGQEENPLLQIISASSLILEALCFDMSSNVHILALQDFQNYFMR